MYRALATLLAVLPTCAAAADLGGPKEAPPEPPSVFRPYTPASCYVQALGSASVSTFTSPGVVTVSASDWTATGGVGCDYRVERFVIGILGRYDRRIGSQDPIKADHAWSGAARLGYMINPGVMGYGLAGITQQTFQADTLKQDARGLLVGAGLEIDLGRGLALTVEYSQARLGSWTDSGIKVDPATQSARLGLTYRFFGSPFDR